MARLAAGVLFHIVNDHLGTPKEMFSEGGDLAWSVDHDTWGTVRRVAGAKQAVRRGDYWVENVAYSVSEATEPATTLCPIRFQGQWEDAESGLYCNRFRYYEPLAGQYVSPDPIGINGGYRNQNYVRSPTTFLDIKGLSCCCWVGEPGKYLYRGVHSKHPQYSNALQGIIEPGDIWNAAGITPTLHNLGGVSGQSPYTSWARDPAFAESFSGPDGVILRIPVGGPAPNDTWRLVLSPDIYGETEELLEGTRRNAEVFDRRKCR